MTLAAEKQSTAVADEGRWKAVLERDSSQDGIFVYAVSSTKIYCRPSCPSRRPLRARVSFFETPDQAEIAGYRACLRCEPKNKESAQVRQVQRAREYLDGHPDETVTLDRLSRVAGMSPFHLQRTFKRIVGVSPKAYAGARRLERMKSRLRKGDTVSRATYEAGYGSGSRAYEHARAGLGMTPRAYREGGRGMVISYTVVPTVAGQLLAAATDRGLCAVMLGDDAASLEGALKKEYPEACIEAGNGELQEYTEAVINRLSGQEGAALPLDLRGTAFQRQVWEALRRIPSGETRSYQAIARELGRPSAARAVARACASNKIAVVIPCHRVVRENGEPGGYRWGIGRKRALLDQERKQRVGMRESTVTPS
jgi:AraC family transcriptional regulator, regulatory protein of adaptative response / methylated-DNA-[protein]-cysteine methyltransferase